MAGTFDLGAMLAEPQLNAEYKRAAEVDAQIKQSAMQAQENLYNMAMGFKKMRDEKLYTALGYANFGDYCEKEIGMKRSNVYNYISVVEKLPSDFVQSIGQRVGMTKLQLLTTLNEEKRTEITETTDLESTSVRELKEKIKSLQAKNDDLIAECQLSDIKRKEEKKKLEQDLETLKKAQNVYEEDLKNITAEKSELEKQLSEQQGNYSIHTKKREEKIAELEKKLEEAQNELTSRPIEVVNSDDNEKIESLEMQLEQAQEELKRERNKSIPDNVVRFKAAVSGAEQALHGLLTACLNYSQGEGEVINLIEKFNKEFKDCMEEVKNIAD